MTVEYVFTHKIFNNQEKRIYISIIYILGGKK